MKRSFDLGTLDPLFQGWELTFTDDSDQTVTPLFEAPVPTQLPVSVVSGLPPDPTDEPPFAKGAPIVLTNQLYAGQQGEVVDCTWSGGNAYRAKPHWLVKVQVQGTKYAHHQVVFYDDEMIAKRQRPLRVGGAT